MDPSSGNWPLLARLKRAVKKFSILMTFSSNQITRSSWPLDSIFRSSVPNRKPQRRLTFGDRPGLIAYTELDSSYVANNSVVDSARSSATPSPGGDSSSSLQRTISSPVSNPHLVQRTVSFPAEDDIDKRADLFIANFYKQLRLQRQISLDLRYCRRQSFGSSATPTPSPSPH